MGVEFQEVRKKKHDNASESPPALKQIASNAHIDMRAFGSYDVVGFGMEFFIADLANSYDTVERFVFEDRYEGPCAYDSSKVVFMRIEDETSITITYHVDCRGDREWYNKNKALVFAVAATLKFDC